MSALLRSCFTRALSLCAMVAVLTTTMVPSAGAARFRGLAEPSPGDAEPPQVAYERLTDEGGVLVAEGKLAEGAARFSEGYMLMPAALRVGEAGRTAVTLASNAYEAAWQATADAGQLEANQVLLRAYIADLDAARAAGQPAMPADDHEQALRVRSIDIERMLAQVQAPAEPAIAPTPAPTLDPATIEAQPELTFPPPDPRLRRNALVLVGVGAATAVAGGIMVIAGAVKASRAEEQRSMMLAEDAADARSSKTAGAILATTGAVLFSGSVMMLGVGSNRLGDLRREMALTLRPSIGGVVVRGRF